MLDLDDLADEVGRLDELGRRVAAGDDHVLEARAVAQRGDDLVLVEPAELHRVGELVEKQELVALVGDPAADLGPALAGAVGRLLEVLADPRPAVAHLLPVDPAQLARGLVLADLPLARLDELEDPAAIAPRPRAHEHPEGARRLALAVAGEDDEQRTVARLAALRVGAAGVVGDLGHAALLGAVGCRAASGSSWAPAARAAPGVAAALARDELGRGAQAGGQGRRAAGGQGAEHGGGALDAAGGREHDLRPRAAEGDQGDAVAPAVGVEEQAEDRALDRGHAPARAHRPAGVDAEDDEVALAPGADVLAQVCRGERWAVGQRAAARGGAQAGGDGEVGHRAARLAAVDGLALGAGGAAAPPGGSVTEAGEAERRGARGRPRGVDALGRGRVRVGRGVGRRAQAARLGAGRSGGAGGGRGGRRAGARGVPVALAVPRARVGLAIVAAGLVHRLLELCVV